MKRSSEFKPYIISVVVPIFHGKQYIKDLIAQIEEGRKKLSFNEKIELIFVNDDPAEPIFIEDTSELVDITVLPTDCNRGIHGARVRGLENSTGKYVLFLDQDDRIHPDYFYSQLHCIKNNDAVVCQVIHEKKLFYNTMTPFHKIMSKEFMFENGSPIISPGQVLLRRESIPVLWKTHIIGHNGADDFFLWLCMLAEGKIFALNEDVLFEHTVRHDNASLNSYNMMRSEEEVVHALQENLIFPENENVLLERMLQKIRKKMLGNLDKFRRMFYVLDEWIASEEKGRMFEKYLTSHGVRHVAVYGYGPLGKRLVRQLDGSSVHMEYIIDQNAAFLETKCPAFTLEDDLEDVDAVIISLVQDEMAIAEAIKRKLSAKILTISKAVKEMGEETAGAGF